MLTLLCVYIQPRQYVAGSSRDPTEGGISPIVLVAAGLGVGILLVGLAANKDTGAPSRSLAYSAYPTASLHVPPDNFQMRNQTDGLDVN